MTDPYAVLGVSPSISDDELTGVYRKLAKKYHPDMNAGSKAAEKKMQEINAAYDQIKNERSGTGSSTGGGAGPFGYGGAYGSGAGAGGRGYGYGGSYDPFGGFGWYGDGSYDTGRDGSGARNPLFTQVEMYIRSGYYLQALQLLNAFSGADRDAEWFYFGSLANIGLGNRVTALRYAQEAVRLEPGVSAYRNLLFQLERGSYAYRQAGASQGFDMRNIGRMLLQCLFSQLLCYCFCCRPC